VADQLPDLAAAEALRKILRDAGLEERVLPRSKGTRAIGGCRQTLVIRIVPDIDKVTESGDSGPPLRLLPYLHQETVERCDEPCLAAECRSRAVPGSDRLTYLASHAVETSARKLIEDLRNEIPRLFARFADDKPDRVEHYLPRAHAGPALSEGIDRVRFRLPYQDAAEPDEPLNKLAVVCHHIDERLDGDVERAKLAERLAMCRGTIQLMKRAGSLRQLAGKPKHPYDSVVIGDEQASQVLHHLKDRVSLLCVRFHTPESLRNLSHAVRTPVPFVLLARSPNAVSTLDKLLKKTHCLRQLPDMLKGDIVNGKADADQIAVISDLPECRCRFDQAEQEPIPNEHL
jgi:hypothetical protein